MYNDSFQKCMKGIKNKSNKLGLRCAKLISSFGLVWLVFVWLGICLVWVGWAWLGVAWRGLVLFGIRVKLIYQISLLVLDGWGWVGEIETKAKPSLG